MSRVRCFAAFTFAILLLTTSSVLLVSAHANAISSVSVPDRQGQGCVHWRLVSYTVTAVAGPSGELFEYYVVWGDGQGNYQSSSILVSHPLSLTQLADSAPLTCS